MKEGVTVEILREAAKILDEAEERARIRDLQGRIQKSDLGFWSLEDIFRMNRKDDVSG